MKRIYALILAGGVGDRMGSSKPKQFLKLGDRSIVSHTANNFLKHDRIDAVVILTPRGHLDTMRDTLASELSEGSERIDVIEGGRLRNDTIINGIEHIKAKYPFDEDTIVITHDAVRPFVTERIIDDNIKAMDDHVACDTVVPATDTIVQCLDGEIISDIPDRAYLYQGQTPQTFRMLMFEELYKGLSEEEKSILTDAIKVFVIKGEKVKTVEGESANIKVTYPFDMIVAEAILNTK